MVVFVINLSLSASYCNKAPSSNVVELTSDTIATGYNVVEGDISTNVALPIKSKDITLEKDKSVVATSLFSSTIIDDYNEEDRIRRAQIKVIT